MSRMPFLRLMHAVLLFAALSPAWAFAQDLPVFTVQAQVSAAEGDSGHTDVVVPWTLSKPAASEIRFVWETQYFGYGPEPAEDYVAVPATVVQVPPGVTSGSVVVRVLGDTDLESDEQLWLSFHGITGAVTSQNATVASSHIYITNDDDGGRRVLTARDDYYAAIENETLTWLVPVANDTWAIEAVPVTYTQVVTSGPSHGALESIPAPSGIALYNYTPDADFGGRDSFDYRLCNDSNACSTATVFIQVRPSAPVVPVSPANAGVEIVQLSNLRELTAASYSTSALVAPREEVFVMSSDTTPDDPWDSGAGMDWVMVELPPTANGAPAEHRIVVKSLAIIDDQVDVYMGIDSNGDGRPSRDEGYCLAVGNEFTQFVDRRCEMPVMVGAAPVSYWVAAHSRSQDRVDALFQIFDATMDVNGPSLVATGPVRVARKGPARMTVSWRDDSLLMDETRLGFVRMRADDNTILGDYPVWLEYKGYVSPMPLPVGPSRTYRLEVDRVHTQIFVDVPAGAASLTVTSDSAQDVDFYLARDAASIGHAPDLSDAAVVSQRIGASHSAQVTGAALVPGRWYVVPRNHDNQPATVTLTAAIAGVAPAVRPGSYFNAGRGGSGLILYPAGNQLAGLWYTYDDLGRPTWYYLQAPVPGANGVWSSVVYREAWYGTAARGTVVGSATVTPTGPDRFTFTYFLNGQAGSEPFAALGRGCPMFGGSALDISSHWFDPARAGIGYSVQMFPNYEFFATFDYDAAGSPVFLTAERASFGGVEATLPLQHLTGPCPNCVYEAPVRRPAGTLTRRLVDGRLQSIAIAADYVEQWPEEQPRRTWSAIDQVQLLGGTGTAQGCDL